MSSVPFIGLLNNAALLLALGVLYGTLQQRSDALRWKMIRGLFLGVITVGVMANPWQLAPGMIFDTRSIVLSVGGMFLGAVPTTIAVVMAALYRLHVGGVGTFTGITWVVTSGLLGVVWVRLRRRPAHLFSSWEFYFLGLVLQIILLLLMFTLPNPLALPVLSKITFPILVIFPFASVLLARLMASWELQDQQRQALDRSERKYRELVQNSRVLLLQVDNRGIITFINEYAEAFFGFGTEEILGRNVVGTLVPKKDCAGEDLEGVIRMILASPEEFLENENENICRDGRRVRVLWKNTPLRDGSGNAVGVQCIGHDVTEVRRAEAILRGKEEELQRLVELCPVPLMILTRDQRVDNLNRRFSELFGYTLADLPTAGVWWQLACPEEACREAVRGRWEAAAAEAGAGRTDIEPQALQVTCKDGSVRDVIALFASIGEKNIVVIQDMTRERELDRMKSEFIATAAHELRTPLTSVRGFTELLLGGRNLEEERREEFLSIVYEKAGVLERIIDDLLNLGRVESGRVIQLEKSPCDIRALVASAVHAYRREFDDRLFELDWPEEGALEIEADAGKIGQVLENLLSNAVKFSPPGNPIRVAGSLEGGEVRISVRDEGIGMTPQQQARVFDKFYRADGSDTAVSGLGLGMSIARGIVEAHGSRIWVESAPGKGTTVTFALPLGKSGAGARPVSSSAS